MQLIQRIIRCKNSPHRYLVWVAGKVRMVETSKKEGIGLATLMQYFYSLLNLKEAAHKSPLLNQQPTYSPPKTVIYLEDYRSPFVTALLQNDATPHKASNLYYFNSPQLKTAVAASIIGAMASSIMLPALALPTGYQSIVGDIKFESSGNTLDITTKANQSIARYNTFNIGQHETVNFNLPSANSHMLNFIGDRNPSQILGNLNSNGIVYLVNPNGMFFGQNAQVNVAGIVGSTLNINQNNFLNGNYIFEKNQATLGTIVNEGNIHIHDNGLASFIGNKIENKGTISGNNAQIGLYSGNKVKIGFNNSNSIVADIDIIEGVDSTIENAINNSGVISTVGGNVELQAKQQKLYNQLINNNGVIEATGIKNNNGSIEILADGGSVINTGNLNVSNATGKGGSIKVLGDAVALDGNITLNASGKTGGGEILIGGDYQGDNPNIKNADFTYVGHNVKLNADATQTGNGGKVITWADDSTWFYGDISAKGGSLSGNGGFAEVSGKDTLYFYGTADLTAQHGDRGTLLLDPDNIYIMAPKVWLDASQLTGYSNGDAVTTWTDASGNGINATQGTSGNRPIYTTSGINGIATITFDGTNDYLSTGALTDVFSNYTIYTVASSANTANQRAIISNRGFGLGSAQNILYFGHIANQGFIYENAALPGPGIMTSSVLTSNTGFIQSLNVTPTNAYLRVNGSNQAGGAMTNTSIRATAMDVGYDAGNGEYLQGQVSEVMVFGSSLSASEMALMDQYLGNKYGITVPGASNTSVMTQGQIETLSQTANISLSATKDITIGKLNNGVLNLQGTASLSLTADSDNNGTGAVTMVNTADKIRTEGQNITINAGSGITLGDIDTRGVLGDKTTGSISILGSSVNTGNISINSINTTNGNITVNNNGSGNHSITINNSVATAGNINLRARGNVTVNGDLTQSGGSGSSVILVSGFANTDPGSLSNAASALTITGNLNITDNSSKSLYVLSGNDDIFSKSFFTTPNKTFGTTAFTIGEANSGFNWGTGGTIGDSWTTTGLYLSTVGANSDITLRNGFNGQTLQVWTYGAGSDITSGTGVHGTGTLTASGTIDLFSSYGNIDIYGDFNSTGTYGLTRLATGNPYYQNYTWSNYGPTIGSTSKTTVTGDLNITQGGSKYLYIWTGGTDIASSILAKPFFAQDLTFAGMTLATSGNNQPLALNYNITTTGNSGVNGLYLYTAGIGSNITQLAGKTLTSANQFFITSNPTNSIGLLAQPLNIDTRYLITGWTANPDSIYLHDINDVTFYYAPYGGGTGSNALNNFYLTADGSITLATNSILYTNASSGGNITLIADYDQNNIGNLIVNAGITATNGTITLKGSQIDINSTINAGTTGTINIQPTTAKNINIASGTIDNDLPSLLDISNFELSQLKAGTVNIGSASLASDINLAGNLDLSGRTGVDGGAFNLGINTAGNFNTSGYQVQLGRDALWFDGSNDFVSTSGLSVNTAAGASNTVSFWMKWDGQNSKMPVSWNGASYDIFIYNSGIGFNTYQGNTLGVSNAPFVGQWKQVTAVFNNAVPSSANVSLYVDGALQGITDLNAATTTSRSVSTGLLIGGDPTYNFSGMLDNVSVHNRALTAAEVSSLYNSGAGATANRFTSGLVGAWNFSEGIGTTATDASGLGKTGTLTNGPTWVTGKDLTINATGNITTNKIFGEGSVVNLTAGGNINANDYIGVNGSGSQVNLTATGNITNIVASGYKPINFNNLTGNNINITATGTDSPINITGNVTSAGSLTLSSTGSSNGSHTVSVTGNVTNTGGSGSQVTLSGYSFTIGGNLSITNDSGKDLSLTSGGGNLFTKSSFWANPLTFDDVYFSSIIAPPWNGLTTFTQQENWNFDTLHAVFNAGSNPLAELNQAAGKSITAATSIRFDSHSGFNYGNGSSGLRMSTPTLQVWNNNQGGGYYLAPSSNIAIQTNLAPFNPHHFTVLSSNGSVTYNGSFNPTYFTTVTSSANGHITTNNTITSLYTHLAANGSGSDIILNGVLASTTTTGGGIVLRSADDIINNYGVGALSTPGYWLTETYNRSDLFGMPTETIKRYNCTYGTACSNAVEPLGNVALFRQAPIINITANNKAREYGDANPSFDGVLSGFIDGDTSAVLSGSASYTSTATNTTDVGSYTIDSNGTISSSLGYQFNYVDGTLDITKATLTATANNASREYGDANPTFTINYTGFKNSENSSVIDTLATGSTTATNTSNVGSYAINASGALDNNYNFNYVDGTLDITKATLTATADNKTRIYGSSNPAFTVSYTGFKNGETSSVIDTEATGSSSATNTNNVGSYAINTSGAADNNYNFNYVDGTLNISKATLIVSVDNKTRAIGEPNPSFSANYSGFVNGDTLSTIDTNATFSSTANALSSAGRYSIIASGASDNNYTFTYNNGTLTIDNNIGNTSNESPIPYILNPVTNNGPTRTSNDIIYNTEEIEALPTQPDFFIPEIDTSAVDHARTIHIISTTDGSKL